MPRGRKIVDMQSAHLTAQEKQRRKQDERYIVTGAEQLKTPPKWLEDELARKEWRRIVKDLKQIDVIGNLDKTNLAGYCNAYANYVKVTQELSESTYCIERETRTGTIIVKNPLIDIQKTYADEMRRFAALCGMTIDSRLKAAVSKRDTVAEDISGRFGAI